MNDDDEDSKVTNILFSDTSSDEEDSLRDIFVNSSEDEIVAQRTISKSKKQLESIAKYLNALYCMIFKQRTKKFL